jgi:hypothetical protein
LRHLRVFSIDTGLSGSTHRPPLAALRQLEVRRQVEALRGVQVLDTADGPGARREVSELLAATWGKLHHSSVRTRGASRSVGLPESGSPTRAA